MSKNQPTSKTKNTNSQKDINQAYEDLKDRPADELFYMLPKKFKIKNLMAHLIMTLSEHQLRKSRCICQLKPTKI